jgi:hypothetical protein
MAIFLFTGIVLFGSFIISSLLLQRLADLICLRLWQTTPQPALHSSTEEIDHVIAAIITAAIFGLQLRDHPQLAIITALTVYILLLSGGVAKLLLLTRRQIRQVENYQFNLVDDRILLRESNKTIEPVICRLSEQKHPSAEDNRWTYTSAAVELYSPQTGLVACNTYYDRLQATQMIERLIQAGQARHFDVALVGQIGNGDFLSIRLGCSWVPLLCGPLKEIPPQVRNWWKKLITMEHNQARDIEDRGFSRYLQPLHLAAGTGGQLQPEFEQEFSGLEQLLKQADKKLKLINADHLRSLIPSELSPTMAGDTSALLIWRQPQEDK